MATRTEGRSTSAAAEREHHRGSPWHQIARFLGLFLVPFVGVLAAGLIHLWIGGVHLHSGDWSVDQGDHAILWLIGTTLFIVAMTALAAWLAWDFTEHRKTSLRASLAGSVILGGTGFAVNVALGPGWRSAGGFIIATWAVAFVWSLARLDVTRNDKRTDEKQEEGFLEKHDLRGWRARKVTPIADRNGNPMATEIQFKHAEGDTVDKLMAARGAFESATGSPTDMSQVIASDRADESTLRIMHIDPLIEKQELPEFAHIGASIMRPLVAGTYATGFLVQAHLAGGEGFSPSGYMFMGMSRSGKTFDENTVLSDAESRRDVVILYLNKAKGVQDCRPVIPGIEAALIDDAEGPALYREALKQVRRILAYRSGQLGLFGINEWNAEQCWDSPPWRTDPATGRRVQMERMPALIVHVAEADAILMDANSEATHVMSKGLSVGIIAGWSLQRADATKMPTGLRFNIGTVWCFGCGDADSPVMALSDWVIKAGAHPENWKNRKPGYFYFEGLGIDDSLFVVPARSFSTGPDGTDLREELLRRNLAHAPYMAKLDRGSANATGLPGEISWWDRTVAQTDELRRKLLGRPTEEDTANMTASDHANPTANADDEGDDDMAEVQREVREMREVEGVELYPADLGAKFEDAARPLPPRLPEDDRLEWGDSRPEPRDRPAALDAFRKALTELSRDESLRDPADPTGRTTIVTAALILDRYQFRSRPFFSAALNDAARGDVDLDGGLTLAPAPDLGATAGRYRLVRPDAAD